MWRRGGSALSPSGWSGAEELPMGRRGSLQVPGSCFRPGAGCSLEEKVGRCPFQTQLQQDNPGAPRCGAWDKFWSLLRRRMQPEPRHPVHLISK